MTEEMEVITVQQLLDEDLQHLRDAGAEHVVEVLEIQPFVDAVNAVRSAIRKVPALQE